MITRYSHLQDDELFETWRTLYQDMLAALMWKSGNSDQCIAEVDEVENEIKIRMGNFGDLPVDQRAIRRHYAKITDMQRYLEYLKRRKRYYAAKRVSIIIERLQRRVPVAQTYDLVRHMGRGKERERRQKFVEHAVKTIGEIAEEMQGVAKEIAKTKPENITRVQAAAIIRSLQIIEEATQSIEDYFSEFVEQDEEERERN